MTGALGDVIYYFKRLFHYRIYRAADKHMPSFGHDILMLPGQKLCCRRRRLLFLGRQFTYLGPPRQLLARTSFYKIMPAKRAFMREMMMQGHFECKMSRRLLFHWHDADERWLVSAYFCRVYLNARAAGRASRDDSL